jgi:hypothetical protein
MSLHKSQFRLSGYKCSLLSRNTVLPVSWRRSVTAHSCRVHNQARCTHTWSTANHLSTFNQFHNFLLIKDGCLLGCSAVYLVEVYQRFRGPCCLHHQGLMMEAARTSETLINFYQTTLRYNPKDSHLHTHCRENHKSLLITSAEGSLVAGAPIHRSSNCSI